MALMCAENRPLPPFTVPVVRNASSANLAASWLLELKRRCSGPLLPFPAALGVSKVVTVDVKGNWQRWLKVRDLTKGVTYFFRVQARTIAYGPELRASVTAGPAEGEYRASFVRSGLGLHSRRAVLDAQSWHQLRTLLAPPSKACVN